MQWIEALLHADPDAGSGVAELAVLLTVMLGIAVGATRRRTRAGTRAAARVQRSARR